MKAVFLPTCTDQSEIKFYFTVHIIINYIYSSYNLYYYTLLFVYFDSSSPAVILRESLAGKLFSSRAMSKLTEANIIKEFQEFDIQLEYGSAKLDKCEYIHIMIHYDRNNSRESQSK